MMKWNSHGKHIEDVDKLECAPSLCNNNNYYNNIDYFPLLPEPLVALNPKCQIAQNLGNETT